MIHSNIVLDLMGSLSLPHLTNLLLIFAKICHFLEFIWVSEAKKVKIGECLSSALRTSSNEHILQVLD